MGTKERRREQNARTVPVDSEQDERLPTPEPNAAM
jgi:hypothetical protein